MSSIGVVLGSTRPGRLGEQVARWVVDVASERSDLEMGLVEGATSATNQIDSLVTTPAR